MFRCESRTRSKNSNFPLKQVETVFAIYPSRAISRLHSQTRRTPIESYGHQPETRNPPSAIWRLHSRARVCHLISDLPIARHLGTAITILRSSLLKIQIFPPSIPTPAILRLHSQSISGRHLADALATTFTLNLVSFFKIPTKIHIPLSAI